MWAWNGEHVLSSAAVEEIRVIEHDRGAATIPAEHLVLKIPIGPKPSERSTMDRLG